MITIHILSNIPRSKGNQTMAFGQLIVRSIRNIFLEKNVVERLVPDSIPKSRN